MQVDINLYLQKISAAFRRYVLNTLAKLEASEECSENTAVDPNAIQEDITSSSNGASGATPTKTIRQTPSHIPHLTAKEGTPAHSEYTSARSTPMTQTAGSTSHALNGAEEDPANEALRILGNIKSRPSQISSSADPSGEGGYRSYNLDYTPRSVGVSTSISSHPDGVDHTGPGVGATPSTGKQKRFAFNPETKRMEIVMVSSPDASPK